MKPYSLDLRTRVAAAVDRHEGSLRQIAHCFQVSLSFVTRLLRQRRQTGSLAPKPHGGGRPSAFDEVGLEQLRRLVREQPDATLEELRQRWGGSGSRMAVWRALRQLRLSRNKKVLRAQQRETPKVQAKRRAFRRQLAHVDAACLVFVDESGATTAMTRT